MGLRPDGIIGVLSQRGTTPVHRTWIPRLFSGNGMTQLIGVSGDNNCFVGVCITVSGEPIKYSSDHGITWTEVGPDYTFSGFGNRGANTIAEVVNGTIMVAWGQSGYGLPAYSYDYLHGSEWIQAATYGYGSGNQLVGDPVHGFCHYSDSDYALQYSLDGRNWEYVTKPYGFAPARMRWGGTGKGILAVGQYLVHYSVDGGKTWSVQTDAPPALTSGGFEIACGGGRWVMMPQDVGTGSIYYSDDDGVTWVTGPNKPFGYVRSLRYFPNYGSPLWLAPGDGQVLRSSDGLNYVIETDGLTDGINSSSAFPYYDVAADGTNFCLVGNGIYKVCTSPM